MRSIDAVLAAALFAGCASSAVAQGADEERVQLSSFDFAPRELHLRAGQPVALVRTNAASGGHDFSAPEFFAAARVQPGDAAMIEDGEIDVPGHSTRTVHLVPAAGSYKLTCTHTMHALLGMKGRIVVE